MTLLNKCISSAHSHHFRLQMFHASLHIKAFIHTTPQRWPVLPPSAPFHLADSTCAAFRPRHICWAHDSQKSPGHPFALTASSSFFQMVIAVFNDVSGQFFKVQIVNSMTAQTGFLSISTPHPRNNTMPGTQQAFWEHLLNERKALSTCLASWLGLPTHNTIPKS